MSAVEASCHCGSVCLLIESAPEVVTECNCSICRRYGALWAYMAPEQVRFLPEPPPTDTYLWDDRSIAFHRCRTCGCLTHWFPQPHRDQSRMGINARLLHPAVLAAARLRHLDGAVTEAYVD
ncbi:MAG TPA: GFA family protein [Devosia sp.]|nr:GFA family protein [Devosia sp.]